MFHEKTHKICIIECSDNISNLLYYTYFMDLVVEHDNQIIEVKCVFL